MGAASRSSESEQRLSEAVIGVMTDDSRTVVVTRGDVQRLGEALLRLTELMYRCDLM